MSATAITIKFDLEALPAYTDTFVAQLWHVAQANPAPITDMAAGDTAERIGREIIRRWLTNVPAEVWAHQGRHAHLPFAVAERERAATTEGAHHV